LGEGGCEFVLGDLFVVDLEVLEERLVEEASFGVVGFEVGGLDVVGECEGVVDGFEDVLVVDLEALEELVGGDAFAADAFLLFGVDVVADAVGVVGGEQFPFFVVEPDDFGASAGGFFVGGGGESVEMGADGGADPCALLVGEVEGYVVALDGLFDRLDAVVGLGAKACAATAADEVLVGRAAAPRGQYPVPTYVGEFLLGRYCATTDPDEIAEGLAVVERSMKERIVRAGEEELFKSHARENGRVKIIDLLRARLDAKSDAYKAELPSLQLSDIHISDSCREARRRSRTCS
jgi:Putative ATP-dependent Lon protease